MLYLLGICLSTLSSLVLCRGHFPVTAFIAANSSLSWRTVMLWLASTPSSSTSRSATICKYVRKKYLKIKNI